jgi:hypothetical protein
VLVSPGDVAADHAGLLVVAGVVGAVQGKQVGGAAEEVTAFALLLDGLGLAEVMVTTDALQTHPEASQFLVTRKQAHDLFQVKANQRTLLDRCQRLPWHRVPELDRTRDRGPGRIEIRTLKAVSVSHFGSTCRPDPAGHPQDPRPSLPERETAT